MGRSGIHRHRQGIGVEEHLGWSVEVVKHPPNRGASGNYAAILMISLPCISSGFGFHLNRRDFAGRSDQTPLNSQHGARSEPRAQRAPT